MRMTPETNPRRIEPFYQTACPNHPVTLSREPASLIPVTTGNEDGREFLARGMITVTMRWSPVRLHFEFEGEMLQAPSDNYKSEELNFSYLGDNIRIKSDTFEAIGCITAVGMHGLEGLIEDDEITCGNDSSLHAVTFHLANYHEISSSRRVEDREPGDFSPIRDFSEIELLADGWRILLQPHRLIRELNWSAEKEFGNIISGIGQITRSSPKEFTVNSVRNVINALDYFLSFVFLKRMPLMLCVGSNRAKSRIWQLWRTNDVQWVFGHQLKTWLPIGGGDQLSTAFDRFYSKWNSSDWLEPLTLAIDWLLIADSQTEAGNVNGAIAFAQIPFEMLASVASVSGKTAAQKIQGLLLRCRVPLATPCECVNLRLLEQSTEYNSGPELITRVRNTIIHPGENNRKQLGTWEEQFGVSAAVIPVETYRLFRHYLVLVLLHLIGFEGKYRNHLGGKDSVSTLRGHSTPWTKSEVG